MLVAATLVVILVANEWSSPIGSDVYHAHLEAGAAMADGHSPYSDAVTFADGNPYAPANKMIVGYPYPPVVVAAYGWAGALTDPRLVSTAAWLGFLAWLAWGSWSNRHAEIAGVKASLLAVLALAPLSTEVWFMAWTEPLTLALFLGAALIWYRSQVWSGVVLGLALASKQFLVFLLPLVLLHRDEGWLKRSRAALATAGVTLLVGLIPDAPAFVRSIIGNLTSIGFRPDTQSLPGLVNRLGADFSLPNWLWLLASVVAMIALARSSKTTSGFMLRAGFGLGFAFLIGLAFPNYWFLVAGLLALGAALEPGEIAGITSTGAPVTSQLNRADTSTAGV
jgi:hypothetical protein